ncbi:MAG: protein translocase subunit SecD [Solirubrobacteraceae bacterium]
MTDRQRHGLVLLLVAGLIAASAVVITQFKTRLGLDLQGGVELVYKGEKSAQSNVTPAALARAVTVMENRVNQLGVAEPLIQTTGKLDITVELPNVKNTQLAEKEVGTTAQLELYDWEGSALLPPPPANATVASQLLTGNGSASLISQGGSGSPPGGADAGGLSLYQAVELAAKQPLNISKHNARDGDEYYLFGAPGSAACATAAKDANTAPVPGEHCLLSGPADVAASTSYSYGVSQLKPLPLGVSLSEGQVLVIKQGTVVLQAVPASFAHWPQFGSPSTKYFVLKDDVALLGSEITNPEQSTDSTGLPDVSFGFTSAGAKAFQSVTARLAQRGSTDSIAGQSLDQHFAVALDNQLVTVPSIDYRVYPDGINGGSGAEITGSFTISSAQQLANELRLGALPIKLDLISEETVSATLGKQALSQGLLAGLVGLAVVALFLLVFYRVLGLIAIAGLAVYGIYFFALIKLIPITMTLAGIAGLILTIGVAADANIVIFERVKEEIRAGRSIRQGIVTGYRKGLTAIIDANVVTIMTAFILFVLATADVKGFAFTLGIGTFVSLFTAVLATQAILMTMGNSRVISRPSALGAGPRKRTWRFDFMGASRYFFSMSGVILLVGALAVGGRGLNLGIDFTSGTRIQVGLQHTATVAQVKSIMAAVGAGDATVQKVKGKATGANGFQISSKYLTHTASDKVESELQSKFGITGAATSPNFDLTSVGPTFGSQVADSAVIAIIASLVVISVYIALRFDWKFAVPTLIALMHDLLITSGVYALTGRAVTTDTVAALLTILGYSLYDTIIVFDRVRENVPRMPRAAFSQIVNRSMSEVLTRSLATTSCTLMPILALLLFGGSTLKDFAFALLIGVASGAYSSIFIASPVLTHWKEREPHYRSRRAHIIRDLGAVPAYADGAVDVEPTATGPRRTGRITTPQAETVSAAEFERMKRELGIDEEPLTHRTSGLSQRLAHSTADAEEPRPARGRGRAGGIGGGGAGRRAAGGAGATPSRGTDQAPPSRATGAAKPPPRPNGAPAPRAPASAAQSHQPVRGAGATPPPTAADAGQPPPQVTPAPDVAENEGMMPRSPSQRPKSKPRNRRHGRR